jgi:hypothetical protein
MGRGGYQHRAGSSGGLQVRGDIRGVAEYVGIGDGAKELIRLPL